LQFSLRYQFSDKQWESVFVSSHCHYLRWIEHTFCQYCCSSCTNGMVCVDLETFSPL
jgi:hypothetical protein